MNTNESLTSSWRAGIIVQPPSLSLSLFLIPNQPISEFGEFFIHSTTNARRAFQDFIHKLVKSTQ